MAATGRQFQKNGKKLSADCWSVGGYTYVEQFSWKSLRQKKKFKNKTVLHLGSFAAPRM